MGYTLGISEIGLLKAFVCDTAMSTLIADCRRAQDARKIDVPIFPHHKHDHTLTQGFLTREFDWKHFQNRTTTPRGDTASPILIPGTHKPRVNAI